MEELDLIVVMMNPGKSRPLNGINNSDRESVAIPDTTQSKIMEVMLNCEFEYARLLTMKILLIPYLMNGGKMILTNIILKVS